MFRNAAFLCSLLTMAIVAGCGGDSADTSTAELVVPPAEGEFSAFDTPPALVHFEEPQYPGAARRDGIEGTVMVQVIVEEDGLVVDATVLKSSHEALTESALTAARACTFTPGELNGRPVRCTVAVPFKYALM